MEENPLQMSITQLTGVGPKRADAFGRLGIFTIQDLLAHYPRGYDNRQIYKKIIELSHNESVCIHATVVGELQTKIIRKNMKIHTLRVSDGTGFLELVWFNNPFLDARFKKGDSYIFYGKVRLTPKKQMLTPIFEQPGKQKNTGKIVPLYPLTSGLNETLVSNCVAKALSLCGTLQETLPEALRKAYMLCDYHFAVTNMHFPCNKASYEKARRRLAFEELFLFQSALFSIKKRQHSFRASILSVSPEPFLATLPFTFTHAQTQVLHEIMKDMASGITMNRLVCGDVGSGKTAVAAASMYTAVESGYQAAFMAPTEILAMQHYQNLKKMFAPHHINVEFLTGSMPVTARRKALANIQSGAAQIIVGTHALLSTQVQFCRLGLAITDEQHRFGVSQRQTLSAKGENPHVLVMSATPIPRTLALVMYGDLDVSIIDELPPGRQKIDTFVVGEQYRNRIYSFIQKEITAGHQAYVVCPLVEDSEDKMLHSVTEYAKKLQTTVFPNESIGILHGKMNSGEKDAVMYNFQKGIHTVLVATSVIEVGVDVPNATIMLIENAERYGLSQLHQLRGRVGRGSSKSYCILLSQSNGKDASTRLQVMKEEQNGFKIAEADLKQRGPGDFFGIRQHGLPPFRLASLYTDMMLLQQTTEAAQNYVENKLSISAKEKTLLSKQIEDLFNNHVTIN
ncbi:MAG: ATP-dependent DNA helicase RecG [Ruminococcaceae bacterium]|nr:ATP-dependent DNA helicase RecG [Oscillospiraceae bacterium]